MYIFRSVGGFFFVGPPEDGRNLNDMQLEGEYLFSGLAKKVTISEKSTIFVRSSQNLVKITTSWGGQFDQVSLG